MKLKSIIKCSLNLSILLFFSCNSSDNNKINVKPKEIIRIKNDNLTSFQRKWYEMKSKCNILVIKKFYISPKTNVSRPSSNEIWHDSISTVAKINQFRQLFTDSIDGGYSCCPDGHFSISFYKDKNKLGQYFIDTSNLNDKVLFYDIDFQTSYFVELTKWNEFLQNK